MNPPVLQIARLSAPSEEKINARLKVTLLANQAQPDDFLKSRGHEFQALITTAPVGASAELMAKLPNLKVVACRGIGVEKVDLDYTRAHGIAVSCTPDVLTDCVADLALGLMIDTARGMSASDRYVRAGRWPNGNFPLSTKVSGKKLGILGLGKIGKAIAKRAKAFDMEIRYHNRQPVTDCQYGYVSSMVELARWADFFMIAVDGGPQTRNLVTKEVLTALGPKGFIFNISRGTVIDETALIEALQNKTIAGAGLDVFVNEPNINPAFLSMDNVVLIPHTGSGTVETRSAMEGLILENIESFFSTGKLVTPVL
ncbi:2-hydroxyacid dehydrogenase [beta proteobacterium MWH-UniP1]